MRPQLPIRVSSWLTVRVWLPDVPPLAPFRIHCPQCPAYAEDDREGLAVKKLCAHIVTAHSHGDAPRA